MEKNYKNYFKYYLISISVFAFIWLYLKHSVGNDSTISEWIINYQGGFTRRGLPGEIAFHVAQIFEFFESNIVPFMPSYPRPSRYVCY